VQLEIVLVDSQVREALLSRFHWREKHTKLSRPETGACACPSKVEESKRWDEPCLTGNMIRTLVKFGYSKDKRVRKAIDWLPKDQLEDGG
jgi:hypothetical protein